MKGGKAKKKSSQKPKREYHLTPKSTKLELLKLVEINKMSIVDAAEELKMNYETAKAIVIKYRKTGRVEEVRRQKRKTNRQQVCLIKDD